MEQLVNGEHGTGARHLELGVGLANPDPDPDPDPNPKPKPNPDPNPNQHGAGARQLAVLGRALADICNPNPRYI